jgi:hypothetical protein
MYFIQFNTGWTRYCPTEDSFLNQMIHSYKKQFIYPIAIFKPKTICKPLSLPSLESSSLLPASLLVAPSVQQVKTSGAYMMSPTEYRLLSPEERNAFDALCELKGKSIWHIAIENQLQHGSAEGFQHLLESLHSQAEDNEEMMREILGVAFEPVMVLKEIPA